MNKKNLDLYSKIILKIYNKSAKFVCELYYRIYIDIKAIQKLNINKKNFNLYSKMNIRFIMKI